MNADSTFSQILSSSGTYNKDDGKENLRREVFQNINPRKMFWGLFRYSPPSPPPPVEPVATSAGCRRITEKTHFLERDNIQEKLEKY